MVLIFEKDRPILVMRVGEKLARARKYHSPAITQTELADLIRVGRPTLGKWESGNQDAPLKHIEAIARHLGIPLAWFYDGEDTPPPKISREQPGQPITAQEANLSPKFGMTVALPVWQGVLAADGECSFVEGDAELHEVPYMLLGKADPKDCFLIRAAGSSMSPRLEHSEIALVRRNSNPNVNTLVVATRPDNAHFVKALRAGKPPNPYYLWPLNEAFEPIKDVNQWTLEGELIAILKSAEPGKPNIEWSAGSALRA